MGCFRLAMKGLRRTARLFVPVLLLAWAASAPAMARSREIDSVAAHLLDDMKVLASDDFLGRLPGTEGEARTIKWIARQWFDAGLVSGTNDPGHAWFAPVTLVAREPAGSAVQFQRRQGDRGRVLTVQPGEALALTSARRALVEGAPLLFVGRGTGKLPSRAELAGRVAVLLDRRPGADNADEPGGAAAAQGSERQNALLAAGASAVMTVLDGNRRLESVAARRRRSGYALESDRLGGDLEAFVTAAAMERLLGSGKDGAKEGSRLAALQAEADRPDFIPRPLDLSASIEATTRETAIHTHNVIGRLPGRRPEAGAVLLLAHWDHFGICAQPPAEHLICNGAIDNASGVAALTEIARRLSRLPPMDRDIYFLATTGEELGLLGAEAFAESPPLPLKSILAAFNLDSVAIAPAGTPLGVVGKGLTPLDAGIAAVARATGRKLSDSAAANTYIRRQDGWALMRHDLPAVMVTSAYGDVARLERFFDTDYHRPGDVVKPSIELGGAAEDVLFHVALVRWFADPRRYPGATAIRR
jgi:hypothetical protein